MDTESGRFATPRELDGRRHGQGFQQGCDVAQASLATLAVLRRLRALSLFLDLP